MRDTAHWDAYWRSPAAAGQAMFDARLGQQLNTFWRELFEQHQATDQAWRVIDLACGAGDVLRCALTVAGSQPGEFVGLDSSSAAVERLAQHDKRIHGVTASAADVPLDDGAFTLVTSQFGIEYAGPAAFTEAMRLTAAGGTLALVMHLKGGALSAECQHSLAATNDVLATDLLALTRRMFQVGYDVIDGKAPHDSLVRAEQALRPATARVKDVLRRYGADVSAGRITALMQALSTLYARLPKTAPVEALRWCDSAQRELVAYAQRMHAMLDAAVDDAQLDALTETLIESGFAIVRSDCVGIDAGSDAVRVLVAKR